ncbi:MAG: HAD-IA family hydrolase [Anaerolineae bacterium]|nr:HAD-IA family hydrolase [Anaerolineae bacterium]
MIKAVFFDLHGVLVDPYIIHERLPAVQGALLAGRYGGDPAAWAAAHRAIRADWDSYWADLDLDGEDGIDAFWEGELRVLRAHFRLTGTPYPPLSELQQLARARRYLVLRQIDAAYPDAAPAVAALAGMGFRLGVVSNAATAHCQGALEGAGLLPYFDGLIVGSDTVQSFSKGPEAYGLAARRAGVSPQACAVFDDNADGVTGARAVDAHVVLVERPERRDRRPLDKARRAAHAVLPGLSAAVRYVRELSASGDGRSGD